MLNVMLVRYGKKKGEDQTPQQTCMHTCMCTPTSICNAHPIRWVPVSLLVFQERTRVLKPEMCRIFNRLQQTTKMEYVYKTLGGKSSLPISPSKTATSGAHQEQLITLLLTHTWGSHCHCSGKPYAFLLLLLLHSWLNVNCAGLKGSKWEAYWVGMLWAMGTLLLAHMASLGTPSNNI